MSTTRTLLITGSGAAFAGRLVEHLQARGWTVRTVLAPDPMALPPSSALHVETVGDRPTLLEEVEAADAVVLLGGIGSITSVVGDARVLDTVLGHLRPECTVVAVTSLAVYGDAGSRPVTELDLPATPDELAPARAFESRVLAANDWLRGVVVRPGLVYGTGGGDVIAQAIRLAEDHGVSRYFGAETDSLPTVHEDDLISLLTVVLENAAASGVYHAVSGAVSVRGLAEMIAQSAGVSEIAAWDGQSMTAHLGVVASVPRVNVNSDLVRSRASTELRWQPSPSTLRECVGG